MTFVTQGIALHCYRASYVLGAPFFFFFFIFFFFIFYFYFALIISWLECLVFNQMASLVWSAFQYCVLNTSLKESAASQSQTEPVSNPDLVHVN